MNKTFSNNRKLYPSFLEFRHTENRRPPQASATPLETRLQGPAIDTHAHVFRQGLALADTRRHTPDYDATLTQYLALLDAHGVARGVLVQPSFLGTDNSHLVAALRAAAGCAGSPWCRPTSRRRICWRWPRPAWPASGST